MSSSTESRPDPTPEAPAAVPARRSRTRRALRALAWTFTGLLAALLLLGAAAWWWLGSDQSLAFALARTARYLPAGQTLESRDVSGSLRAGGRIGWLRWESESLAVEVRDARIGWRLAPLLQRRVQLGEVHAAQVSITQRPQTESKPVEPLTQIVLPVEVELPFKIDDLRWTGPPALQATGLEGSYRYRNDHHELEIAGVDIADGHYGAQLRLQGPAPMAIDASLNGRVRALLAPERNIDLRADATLRGTLSGPDAQLAVEAEVKPVEEGAEPPMQGRLRANLAPWQPQPVIDAHAELQNLDLARLWPEAPATRLSGEIDAGPDSAAGDNAWKASASIRNTLPGPWDEGRLPVEQLDLRAGYDGSTWTLPQASVRAGGGRIDAEGSWSPAPAPWKVDATVRNVKPGALHTQLAGAPVSGRIQASQASQAGDAIQFDIALQAAGGVGARGDLQGLRLERALAKGQWQGRVLDLRSLRVEAQGASVDGRLQLQVDEQAASGRLNLVMPGGSALVDGRIAPASGSGDLQARVEDAAALQRWVEGLPGLDSAFAGTTLQGNARLDASWRGGWQAVQRRLQETGGPAPRGGAETTLQATLTVPKLEIKPAAAAGATAAPILLTGVRAELAGSLVQATLSLKGEALVQGRKITLDTRASGGIERLNQWNLALASLEASLLDTTQAEAKPWVLTLASPVSAKVRTTAGSAPRLEVDASAASATLRGPAPGSVKIDWQPLRYIRSGTEAQRAYRLTSKGRLQGLPMAWAEVLGGGDAMAKAGFSGDLLFNGEWDVDAGDTLRAKARLVRESGDLRVQAGEAALVTRIRSHGTGTASERTMDAAGPGTATPAGLKRAELTLDAEGDSVRANLAWDSERAGEIRIEAGTRVQQRQGGWQWAGDAPLSGRVSARMPNLGVWSILAPPGWRMAGTLEANATLSGSRDEPRWNGTLAADQLALRALVEGLDLRDGRLRATLSGNRVEVTEFTLKGGAGAQTRIPGQSGNLSTASSEAARGGGSLDGRGELSWGATPAGAAAGSGIRMSMQAQLRALRVLVRADRQLTLSGDLQARLDNGQFSLRGDLKTDRAVIILPDETAPSLGSDVVVRSAAIDRQAAEEAARRTALNQAEVGRAQTAKPPDIAVDFDLGTDFAVQGRGITTRLAGKLAISSKALDAPPRITGEVRTVNGQYRAYGQQLTIETGVARFNGPFDNPQLDILAIRPNLSQRVGVQITGTAQSPRVRLYSEPALSDQETLTWLVLGRASATSGGESVLLQQAALALLGGMGGSGGGLASRFGLDEIGFKGPGTGGDVRESTVTVGKRVARDFYITYEASLGGTLGTFFIFYDLTRRLTLRAQAGQQSAIDLIYTLQFD
ncbi:translocation/assembly module TamB domain-containing protein [Variovorax sp. J22P168]|uniref:translocation/assembly module TamB domain-containing protein n=1 Tax=Variovorax jilinensis TaxID=3053513 RepID=UPI002574B8D3|nr:translocation/assembly module TamB domain-containing protein [Variovorax sp. J22P168]MDM0012365.1 translocation/assembly module TamB domain-containing protein [Variovorax sp. J22P168]